LSPDEVLRGVVGLAVLLFSLVIHENAHGLAAERFGDPTARMMGRITMNPLPHLDPVGSLLLPAMAFIAQMPFIGWAKPVPVNTANLRRGMVHNAYVAAAGPASNILIALASTILYTIVLLLYQHLPFLLANAGNSLLFFHTLFRSLITINLILALFNLIPVPPLDGHWILMSVLPPRGVEVMAKIRPFGFFILIGLLWTGLLWKIIGPPFNFLQSGMFSVIGWAVRTF